MSRADLWCLIEDIDHERTIACVFRPCHWCPFSEWSYLLWEDVE